ncbi:YopX family protein [Neobacillus sp. 114]|uniref:YopX family protein n=1 Tax=Neobacillus sp. 114 TaxID=3048535 RepID=UPI0024C4244A|nr:YopX family protein [Neobacillus sp. 114]
MREIKFRAWEKYLKEIIPVDDINFEKRMINTDSAWRLFDEIELMQYTGLSDKNSREIYEGDIVVLNTSHKVLDVQFNPEIYVVQWRSSGACFDMLHKDYLNHERKVGLMFDNGMVDSVEVIGNIYENPELLEE